MRIRMRNAGALPKALTSTKYRARRVPVITRLPQPFRPRVEEHMMFRSLYLDRPTRWRRSHAFANLGLRLIRVRAGCGPTCGASAAVCNLRNGCWTLAAERRLMPLYLLIATM